MSYDCLILIFSVMDKKSLDVISLNSELPQLYVEELEKRLETDPLLVGGLLDASTPFGAESDCLFSCGDFACDWF